MLQLRIASCLAALAIAAPAVADDSITVDCSTSKTVGEVLADKARKDKPLVLLVQGNCTEDVTIDRDDVTLQGDGAGATITGSVTIDAGRRVVVANLTVTNPAGDGVTVINDAAATIRDSSIVYNGGYGVVLRNAAFALVNRNQLSNNGQSNAAASGIGVFAGSTVRALDNTIVDNAHAGIEVGDSSNYRSDGDGVAVRTSPAGFGALDIYRAGIVDLRRVSVNGSVEVNQQSQLQIRNVEGFPASTITGNVIVSVLSFFRLRSGVVHTVTLSCSGGSFSVCRIDP
jgi:hypothetical protein